MRKSIPDEIINNTPARPQAAIAYVENKPGTTAKIIVSNIPPISNTYHVTLMNHRGPNAPIEPRRVTQIKIPTIGSTIVWMGYSKLCLEANTIIMIWNTIAVIEPNAAKIFVNFAYLNFQ